MPKKCKQLKEEEKFESRYANEEFLGWRRMTQVYDLNPDIASSVTCKYCFQSARAAWDAAMKTISERTCYNCHWMTGNNDYQTGCKDARIDYHCKCWKRKEK